MLQVAPTDFDVFIPMMGMATGVVAMVLIAVTVIKVAQSQLGQAMARRIAGKSGGGDPELREELIELREQVSQLEHRLAETDERIDFTERLLTRGKDEVKANGH